MENIKMGLILVAVGSLYTNYLLWKAFKTLKKADKIKSEISLKDREQFFEILNEKNRVIENREKVYNEIKNSRDNLRGIITKTQIRYDNLELDYKKLVESNGRLGREFDSLAISHKKIVATNEKLYSNFLKTEEELSVLDMAYDELMKAYNSNAMDLYFWNLLPRLDRETRRKFLKTGKYKVYNLSTGQLCFEVE